MNETINATNMEIEQLSKDELITKYVELQKIQNKIEMNMSFMKQRLQALLEKEGQTKYANSLGEASIVSQKRNQFMQNVAKGFLSEEELTKCYMPKEVTFVKVMSTEAKQNMRF